MKRVSLLPPVVRQDDDRLGTRRRVPRSTFKAEPLKASAEPVGKLAVNVDVEMLVSDGVRFHAFGHYRKRGGPPAKLPLAFRQEVGTAHVGEDLFEHVLEPAVRRAPAVSIAFENE